MQWAEHIELVCTKYYLVSLEFCVPGPEEAEDHRRDWMPVFRGSSLPLGFTQEEKGQQVHFCIHGRNSYSESPKNIQEQGSPLLSCKWAHTLFMLLGRKTSFSPWRKRFPFLVTINILSGCIFSLAVAPVFGTLTCSLHSAWV